MVVAKIFIFFVTIINVLRQICRVRDDRRHHYVYSPLVSWIAFLRPPHPAAKKLTNNERQGVSHENVVSMSLSTFLPSPRLPAVLVPFPFAGRSEVAPRR